jgi:hypothetical protein
MEKTNRPFSPGRPTLPKHIRKSIVVCVRLDEPTYALCKRAATITGLAMPQWVRLRLLIAAQRELNA